MSPLAGIAAHDFAASSRRAIRKTYSRAAISKAVSTQADSDEDELALPTPSRRPDRRSKFTVRSESEEFKDNTTPCNPTTAHLPGTPRLKRLTSPPSRKRKLQTGPLFLTKLDQDHELEPLDHGTDKGIDILSTDELVGDEKSNSVSPSDRKRVKQDAPKTAIEARPKKKVRFVLEPRDEFRHPPRSTKKNRRDFLIEGDGFHEYKRASKGPASTPLKTKEQQVPPETSTAEVHLTAQKALVATEFRALCLTSESHAKLLSETGAVQTPSQNVGFGGHDGGHDWQQGLKADAREDGQNSITLGVEREQRYAMLLDDQHSGGSQGPFSSPCPGTSNVADRSEVLQGDPDSEVHIS